MDPSELDFVDEEYETRMVGFEVDCNDGKGEPAACHHVAEFFSVVKNDKARAAKLFAQNCETNDHMPSCFSLARLYAIGKGVEVDMTKAESLFKKGCEGGLPHSCYFYGTMMLASADKMKDAAKKTETTQNAIKLLTENCMNGDVESCYTVGGYHISQSNPHRDPVKAEEVLKASCEKCHAPSCYNLAVMYKNGDTGVPKDSTLYNKYKAQTNKLINQRKKIFVNLLKEDRVLASPQ